MDQNDNAQQDGGSLFTAALTTIDQSNNLARSEVIGEVVRTFVSELMNAGNEDDVTRAIDRTAAVFSGVDRSWQRPTGWASHSGIGRAIAEAYAVDDAQMLHDIVRTGMAQIAHDLYAAVAKLHDDEKLLQVKVDQIIAKAVAVLSGAYSATGGHS